VYVILNAVEMPSCGGKTYRGAAAYLHTESLQKQGIFFTAP
jgi:hypothetical protein